MTSITEEPLRLFIFLPLPPSLVIYANEIVDREKEIEIITKRSSTNISTKILVSTTESSKQMSRILPNPNDRRGSPESRKCPRSIGDPTFQLSYKDLAKIDDDLSHNVCHCPMNLIPRFPQVSLYIYTHTYIWMFFPHGSLPRRAETYATPARNEAFTPPPRGEEKRRRNFRRVSIPKSVTGIVSRFFFSVVVTWTLCNFFPPLLRGAICAHRLARGGIDRNLLRDTVSLRFITDARCNK